MAGDQGERVGEIASTATDQRQAVGELALAPNPATRELDHRRSDGIDVRLLWNSRDNRVSVAVEDSHTGEAFVLDVPGGAARDAFLHPYAYTRPEQPAA